MLSLSKYSFGIGDRFAHQAKAQLHAFQLVATAGAEVVPVWNKSNREHETIGSEPASVRIAAEQAVRELNWSRPYHVDADHIRLETVERFLATSDFFTLDVADSIGLGGADASGFAKRHPELIGKLEIPGIAEEFGISGEEVERVAGKYLMAVQEAGRIFRRIANAKGENNCIIEVSMDETDVPQTPHELLVILAALAEEKIPLQTIAPKFTGRFNKGVDYVGDIAQFEKEFNDDLAVIAYAVKSYGLPANLKLSVHSGSDKFSIYPPIRGALKRFDAGLHIKTAGTTWLEEVIGLADAGGEGLKLAKEIYVSALAKREVLSAPYAAVIDIDADNLPSPASVQNWSSEEFVSALRHDQANPAFNPSMRQLIHVGYKIAAQMGDRYLSMLKVCENSISKNVTYNLYDRHLKPLFIDNSEAGK